MCDIIALKDGERMNIMRKILVVIIGITLTSCGNAATKTEQAETTTTTKPTETTAVTTEQTTVGTTEDISEEKVMYMEINGTPITVEWEDNESVAALKELCENSPLTIQMSMYGGFEQVGYIGSELSRNDVQTTTNSGDIVLYSGD